MKAISFLQKAQGFRAISTSRILLTDEHFNKKLDYYRKVTKELQQKSQEMKEYVDKKTSRWKEMHEIYYGPDRDLKNFPPIKYADHHPNVRLGVIPATWLEEMSKKTGQTGPYLFIFGSYLFMVSKEIIPNNHHHGVLINSIIAIFLYGRLFGPYLKKHFYPLIETKMWVCGERDKTNSYKEADFYLKQVEDQNLQVAKALEMVKLSKENIGFQLEKQYRERIRDLHKAVKDKLDYQVLKESIIRKFQKENAINWIVNGVIKDFGPEQEKKVMSQCIADLKILAQKENAVA